MFICLHIICSPSQLHIYFQIPYLWKSGITLAVVIYGVHLSAEEPGFVLQAEADPSDPSWADSGLSWGGGDRSDQAWRDQGRREDLLLCRSISPHSTLKLWETPEPTQPFPGAAPSCPPLGIWALGTWHFFLSSRESHWKGDREVSIFKCYNVLVVLPLIQFIVV